MSLDDANIIGVVGGMGPQAGIALCNSIMRYTSASIDQEHLSTILMSFPKHIADRTAYLEGASATNPAFAIARVIRKLEAAGARIIGMACNTSHSPDIFNTVLDELNKINSRIKLLNMPEETCQYVRVAYPHIRRVGLLTTNGTYKSGIYKDILCRMGYTVVVPEYGFQDRVIHRMVYDRQFGLKANQSGVTGEVRSLMKEALKFFMAKQADTIILGCTEFSLVMAEDNGAAMTVVDSTDCLARALVREASKDILNTMYDGEDVPQAQRGN